MIDKLDEKLITTVAELPLSSLPGSDIPSEDVLIRVEYSSLNYKDALASRGHRGVVRNFPHVPGIDCAGTVVESPSGSSLNPGDRVLVTGYDFGQGHWGGWSELARVPIAWVVPLPANMSTRQAMEMGTAGFTAAQSVLALQRNGVTPASGELVVTGATGGVASLSIRILAKLGYSVVAVTGKLERSEDLIAAGATRVLLRAEFIDRSERPMLSAKWAGGIDTVGGEMLTTLLRSTQYGGCVSACGLVAGADLAMSVYPFLLRGITLCGIASADCPDEKRRYIWNLLANDWRPEGVSDMVTEVELEEVLAQVEKILDAKVSGRVLIRLADSRS